MPARRFRLLVASSAVLLAAAAVIFFVSLNSTAPVPEPPAPEPPPAPVPVVQYDAFGIEDGVFQTVSHKVRRNQTFGAILTDYNVPYPTINRLVQASSDVFDVRRMRAGKTLHLYRDSTNAPPRYLVYEEDPVEYIVFDLGDSLQVEARTRPVEVTRREVEGIIRGSLYETLAESNLSAELSTLLTIKLSEVYAWQVDFYRIQAGDGFKVIFEEKSVDGVSVGLGEILAARFNHRSKDFLAFNFEQDGQTEYFDEEGNSLRKAFLIAPVKYSRISSRYTGRRFHPVQKRWKAHLGTDYAAPYGTPIYATGNGVVVEAGRTSGNGNYVKIRHNGTYTTGYLHMSKIGRGIRRGVAVEQGQVIGYVGSTGLATGNHVCYRFWKNGQQVDPLRQEFPSSHPVSEANRTAFELATASFMDELRGWSPDGTTPDETPFVPVLAQEGTDLLTVSPD